MNSCAQLHRDTQNLYTVKAQFVRHFHIILLIVYILAKH